MSDEGRYGLVKNCHIGEIDGYGYALVPGSDIGVVLLDLKTKQFLENSSNLQRIDERRARLLLDKKLICFKNEDLLQPTTLNINRVKSIGTWLHLTNSCNLSCPYCYVVNKCSNQHMPLSIIKAYLNKLEETVERHKLKFVSIRIAGGEPTLCKDSIYFLVNEMKRRFLSNGISVQLVLLTNGTTLDLNFIKFLKSHSVGICISLDGLDKWHDQTRYFSNGIGSFRSVVKNIYACKEHGLIPTVLSTIVESNISGASSLNKFLINENLPFRFGVFRDNTGGFFGYADFIEKVSSVLEECYDYYASAIRGGRSIFRYQLSEVHIDKRFHLRSCSVGYAGVTVSHAGDVFLCQSIMDRKPIGNLRDRDTLLEMAWSQKTFPELNGGSVFDYEGCSDCQWALICGGGCPVVNANANGLATTASPYCKLFKFIIPRLIELKALSSILKFKKRR